ncbi:MAG: pyrimidine reductase, riboflavin biosynthesis [Monoraphidium minutum]|nr:MAG: pyrimidine reductase, riboflavin biosynthesis [Monoraphidium minutum]
MHLSSARKAPMAAHRARLPVRMARAPLMCRASSAATLGKVTAEDRVWMNRALDLAMLAYGKTAPNPHVGCVIVRDGQAVGEGYHPKAGQPHAEVWALRAAGQAARGATAYVTLEPCNHYGRTPPCSQALVEAGVKRVVVGAGDPNPLVAAAGIATLTSAGIEVAMMDGPENRRAIDINTEFMARMEEEARAEMARLEVLAKTREATGGGH